MSNKVSFVRTLSKTIANDNQYLIALSVELKNELDLKPGELIQVTVQRVKVEPVE